MELEREPILVGERVAELRRRARMSQMALADVVGVSQASISGFERGRTTQVDAWIVAKMAAALGTTMDYLLALTDDPSPRHGGSRMAVDEAIRQVLLLSPEARDALAEFLRLLQIADRSNGESEHTP